MQVPDAIYGRDAENYKHNLRHAQPAVWNAKYPRRGTLALKMQGQKAHFICQAYADLPVIDVEALETGEPSELCRALHRISFQLVAKQRFQRSSCPFAVLHVPSSSDSSSVKIRLPQLPSPVFREMVLLAELPRRLRDRLDISANAGTGGNRLVFFAFAIHFCGKNFPHYCFRLQFTK
jgi:hypothetical protein